MKIYIVGIVASGKTTLARRWSGELDIPFYELDCIIYGKKDGVRYKRTPEEQQKIIEKIDQQGDWIIEGTYRKSCHELLDLADKIIFLDPPLWKRRVRILSRYVKQICGLEKCHYTPTLSMLRSMYNWSDDFEKNREKFETMLFRYGHKLILLRQYKGVYIKGNEVLEFIDG